MRSVMLCTALVAATFSAQAQQLPNQVDLKAAYCIPIAQNEIALLTTPVPDNSPPLADEYKRMFAQTLDKKNTNLRRLQLYLVPRVQYLDTLGLEAARKRGEEDAARASRDVSACISGCQDITCITKCSNESEAAVRTRTCNDLSFLPF
jgi:hypothetical protein